KWNTGGVARCSLISDTDLDGFQTIQNVEFGQATAGNAVDTISMTNSNDIKPATAALTSGAWTKFLPFLSPADADLAIQPWREWAGTHASGVGFGDPQYIIQIHGAEAGACRGTTCGGVGGSHKWIGPVVNIQ